MSTVKPNKTYPMKYEIVLADKPQVKIFRPRKIKEIEY